MLQYNVIWLNGERIGTNIKQIYSLSKLATYKKAKATLQEQQKGLLSPQLSNYTFFLTTFGRKLYILMSCTVYS